MRVLFSDNIPQIVYYQSGVGSESDFLGSINPTGTTKVVITSKIRDAYGFLAQNFEVGDEIFLFGGAYVARKLAELIDCIGLLTTKNLGFFFNIWKELSDGVSPVIPSGTRVTRIRCLCVWDTVEPIYAVDALRLEDTVLPASVDVALHALSLQENRKEFRPTLFTLAVGSNQVLKECWFPGAHSDIGGSYPRHELADISLFWMAGEIKNLSLFDLDYDFIERSKQPSPRSDWGSSQPHNAYKETPMWMKTAQLIHAQNRLESGDITRRISYHISWKYAPSRPRDPYDMITRSALETKFRTTTYVALNDYEKGCKDRWSDTMVGRGDCCKPNYWITNLCSEWITDYLR
ncbi:hypothetical protein DFH94DRAFT_640158 [Russula ochroleuca]|uniref:T6SS Phospholipase effector Tle1-like catalytic domain-containing protein n=1 Tax=Russula ochroleuca TaxID=152965 RepID=A0A9P5JVH3_9AGAM|nr:hypothetical protein DFH94DRAFT_640158 [Russula ochroleuca]